MSENRLKVIDSLKGISSIIIACIYHLGTGGFYSDRGLFLEKNIIMSFFYNYGFYFVEFFLMLSGFIFFYVYRDKIIRQNINFNSFIIKRYIRICPLMWTTLFTSFLGQVIFYYLEGNFWLDTGNNTVFTLFLHILGLQKFFPINQSWNYPAWSLSVFLVCWIIFFIIIKVSKGNMSIQIIASLSMILLGITLQVNLSFPLPLLNSEIARGYIAFFAGGIIYYIYEYNSNIKFIKRGGGIVLICVVYILHNVINISIEPLGLILTLIFFPLVLLSCLEINWLNKILSLKPLVYLGKVSFSIYLCNFTVQIFTVILNSKLNNCLNYSSWEFFVGNILFQILIGSIFYKYIEINLSQRLYNKIFKIG